MSTPINDGTRLPWGVAEARPRPDRVVRAALTVLASSLAAVYIGSALTMPAGHPALAIVETGLGMAQVLWVLAFLRTQARRAVLAAGLALQLGLAGVWIVSRTAGIPGQGRLPVGELDVVCLLDTLLASALLLDCVAPRRLHRRLPSIVPGQVAVGMAAMTLFAWSGGHAHAATGSAGKIVWGAQAASPQHFYCHLL